MQEVEADDLSQVIQCIINDYNIKIISSDKDLMQLLQYDNVYDRPNEKQGDRKRGCIKKFE